MHIKPKCLAPVGNGVKRECIRPGIPFSLGDARRLLADYIDYYNQIRGITPLDM